MHQPDGPADEVCNGFKEQAWKSRVFAYNVVLGVHMDLGESIARIVSAIWLGEKSNRKESWQSRSIILWLGRACRMLLA